MSEEVNILEVKPFSRCYRKGYAKFAIYERILDFEGWKTKQEAWFHGLWQRGLEGAHDAAAGLKHLET